MKGDGEHHNTRRYFFIDPSFQNDYVPPQTTPLRFHRQRNPKIKNHRIWKIPLSENHQEK